MGGHRRHLETHPARHRAGWRLGILPGTGPLISSFASYGLERSPGTRSHARFGKGAIEGVAGPEAANNAAAITHFIPMLALGISPALPTRLMLGALIIQGITPGPSVITDHADLFWGVVASMWIGNAMLLVLNLPLVGVWISPAAHAIPLCCIPPSSRSVASAFTA